jgi:hypothetical protein
VFRITCPLATLWTTRLSAKRCWTKCPVSDCKFH